MKRNALLTLVCCMLMEVAAMVASPVTAMAVPYHATDTELQGSAYAVFNPTTGELDFVRSTEKHTNGESGTVMSISSGAYTGTIYADFENVSFLDSYHYFPWWNVGSQVESVRFVDAVRPRITYKWFEDLKNCKTMDLARFDTSHVTDMCAMFSECYDLTQLDLSGFDTSKVTYMNAMFSSCESLTSLDLSSFDTSQVTNMYIMFQDCSSLTSLDLSSFDTSRVTNMDQMFNVCKSLDKLTVGDKFVIN